MGKEIELNKAERILLLKNILNRSEMAEGEKDRLNWHTDLTKDEYSRYSSGAIYFSQFVGNKKKPWVLEIYKGRGFVIDLKLYDSFDPSSRDEGSLIFKISGDLIFPKVINKEAKYLQEILDIASKEYILEQQRSKEQTLAFKTSKKEEAFRDLLSN